MIRIRQIHDIHTPRNDATIARVQEIMRAQMAKVPSSYIEDLPLLIGDPVSARFSVVLFVAETGQGDVRGFAMLLHATDLGFGFLEMIAAAPGGTSRGVGGLLYERVRDEAIRRRLDGLFFECLTDHPEHQRSPEEHRQNVARLRFYERYGARPIVNSRYDEPDDEGRYQPMFLMYDPLGHDRLPGSNRVRRVVRALLERKYADLIPPAQIESVAGSFRDDPVALRPPRYLARDASLPTKVPREAHGTIPLVVSDGHQIHHVTSRGYFESPVRLRTILPEIEQTGLFRRVPARAFPVRVLTTVHDPAFVTYLRRASARVDGKHSIYPEVFPIRNRARPPRQMPHRAGYYCIDTFTPLNENAYRAAKHSVDCAMTAANLVLDGAHVAYALVRPPGHHAESAAMAGYC
jgi:GNAT superfamily N-acetyltransferase